MTVFWHSFKRQLRGARWYGLGLFLYSWMMLAVWPTLQKIDLNQFLSMYPKEFLQFFGGGNAVSLSTIEGFLSLEYLSLFFVLIIGFHLASNAGAAIAGAVENKTLDFMLAQPVARRSLIWQEIAAVTLSTIVLVWIGVGSIWLQAAIYKVTISGAGLAVFGVLASLFLWLWIGLAFLVSAATSNKMTVAAGTMGLMILTYTLTALAGLTDKVKAVSHLSPFGMYDPATTIQNHSLSGRDALIMFAIGLAASWLASLIFVRRDI